MRKILVVLLASLLLLSFTSCNQDKIEELEKKVAQEQEKVKQEQEQVEQEKANHEATIKNFEDFIIANGVISTYSRMYRNILVSPSNSVNVVLNKTNVTQALNKELPSLIFPLEKEESIKTGSVSVEEASGDIAGKNIYHNSSYSSFSSDIPDDIDLTITNNSITIKYSVNDKDGNSIVAKTDLTTTIRLNGKYVQKEDAKTGDSSISFKGKINGTEYNFSYTLNKDNLFTSAKINGTNVELRLLNAEVRTGM